MSKKNAAKSKKPKAIKVKRFEERQLPCKHVFDAAERLELGNKLAAAMQTYAEVEAQLKSISADYKAKMKNITTEKDQYAARIRDGYEMRELKCLVYFNTATVDGKPKKKQGTKRIVNAVTKEFIRDEPMSQADLQAEMFTEEKIKQESKAAKAKKAAKEPNISGAPTKDAALNSPELPKEGGTTSTAATS